MPELTRAQLGERFRRRQEEYRWQRIQESWDSGEILNFCIHCGEELEPNHFNPCCDGGELPEWL